MTTKREGMPPPVRRVDEQFERWRADKQGHERIPPQLWAAAAGLCEDYGVHKVSRWLHLNHTALQHRAGEQGTASRRHRRRGRTSSKPSFVEYSLPAGLVGGSAAEYVVELKGCVPRIQVRGASALEVAALVGALSGRA